MNIIISLKSSIQIMYSKCIWLFVVWFILLPIWVPYESHGASEVKSDVPVPDSVKDIVNDHISISISTVVKCKLVQVYPPLAQKTVNSIAAVNDIKPTGRSIDTASATEPVIPSDIPA